MSSNMILPSDSSRPPGTSGPLMPDRVLDVAEDVLRRFGPAKANVIDVARALRVSHGSIYRHFPSKMALLDAVAERWLARISGPLALIAAEPGPAIERLRRWFDVYIATLRRKAESDPDLFATYSMLASRRSEVVVAHGEQLKTHIAKIVDDGIRQGVFTAIEAHLAGLAIFDATTRFHSPLHAPDWAGPNINSDFETIWRLILRGLGVPK